jgi:hypothetical protein
MVLRHARERKRSRPRARAQSSYSPRARRGTQYGAARYRRPACRALRGARPRWRDARPVMKAGAARAAKQTAAAPHEHQSRRARRRLPLSARRSEPAGHPRASATPRATHRACKHTGRGAIARLEKQRSGAGVARHSVCRPRGERDADRRGHLLGRRRGSATRLLFAAGPAISRQLGHCRLVQRRTPTTGRAVRCRTSSLSVHSSFVKPRC